MAQIIEPARLQNRADAFWGVSLHIIGLVFAARFFMDIGTRMIFPFIPQISSGLGLTVVGFSWLIFIRALVGVAGPLFGMWSDRYGRRRMMALSLLCQAIGVIGLTFSPHWWATLPMILFGLSLAGFLPAQQAYISDKVPYQRRGRALAAVEFSWSAVAILILPLVGWMIDAFGWRSPFIALGLLSMAGAVLVQWRLPPAAHRRTQGLSWAETRAVFLKGNVLASIGVALLLFVALSSFLTVWGVWLSAEFNFDAATIGLVATAVGIAELTGVSLSSLFIDRIGKQRGSGIGFVLLAAAFAALPFTGGASVMAVATLIVMGAVFEFTIVSLFPLYSEQVPEARGTVLALAFLGTGVGGAIGPPIATTLWEALGLGAVSGVAIACLLLALGLMGKFLHETHYTQTTLDN